MSGKMNWDRSNREMKQASPSFGSAPDRVFLPPDRHRDDPDPRELPPTEGQRKKLLDLGVAGEAPSSQAEASDLITEALVRMGCGYPHVAPFSRSQMKRVARIRRRVESGSRKART